MASIVIGLIVGPVALVTVAAAPAPPTLADAPAVALLTSVTAQNMGDFDRVTFTFDKGTPAISSAVWATGPATFIPSENPVSPPIAGTARLVVTMTNAADEDLTASPIVVTYPGPLRFSANLPNVTELVQLQDFEATLTWAIGVNSSGVTAVAQVLSTPTRVQVDIPHATSAVTTSPSFTG
jgi:hypothetical protein